VRVYRPFYCCFEFRGTDLSSKLRVASAGQSVSATLGVPKATPAVTATPPAKATPAVTATPPTKATPAVSSAGGVPAQLTMHDKKPLAKTMLAGSQIMHPDGRTYSWQAMPNKTWQDLIPLMIPCGPKTVTYKDESENGSFLLKNQCSPLCPWTVVDANGGVKATAAKPGMCTNGCMYCLCPLCVFAGNAKTFMINDGAGKEVLTMQMKLYPGWSVFSCEGTALALGAFFDCKEICSGKVMKTLRQPVYGPLESISSTSEQLGVMEVTYINMPNSPCTAQSYTQVKCEFVPREGLEPTEEQKQAIALLIMLFKGQSIKDCLTAPGVIFPVARGNQCADAGLGASYEYHNLEEVKAFLVKEARYVVAGAGV